MIECDTDSRGAALHIWRVAPRHLAAILSVAAHHPPEPDRYKCSLANQRDLAHVTVEVHRCPDGAGVAV